jgi:hypothetical protein
MDNNIKTKTNCSFFLYRSEINHMMCNFYFYSLAECGWEQIGCKVQKADGRQCNLRTKMMKNIG